MQPIAAWQAAPAANAVSVSPHDTNQIAAYRALYVGVTGDVKVTTIAGAAATFKNVPVGILPIQGTQVFNTGTTASQILALY